uniref:L-ectoine synthase n=1 Tax=Globisporangium ultimum (strain ATCC 200006 / CBS 805.95 / DAOM BR144) TaxID=431595 RepID=K3WIQ0_GLOUD
MLMSLRASASAAASHTLGRRLLHASRASSFLFRGPADVNAVTSENGALESRRYLLRGDACGFSVQHEILKKGTPARLEFRNHVYAVMITSGHGKVALLDHQGKVNKNHVHSVSAGSFFALNASESIELQAESDELHAVSVMNPPLVGSEQRLANGVFPVVDQDGVEREEYDHTMSRRLFEAPESLKAGSSPMKNDPLF